MSLKSCLTFVKMAALPGWQTGQAMPSLRSAGEKLEKPCRSYRRNRRAAAAVEFAIVAPVFFLLVFGMIEYGRMVMVQQVITNASREGARRAVLDGATYTEVKKVVDKYLDSASIDEASAEVDTSPDEPADAEFGDPVTVTVSIPFDEVSWLPSPMYLGGKVLTATTVMRRESVQ
ncbi:MAG: TadE/TadG family type IV pilus assembly protein [Pirellulaceae bacterium]